MGKNILLGDFLGDFLGDLLGVVVTQGCKVSTVLFTKLLNNKLGSTLQIKTTLTNPNTIVRCGTF
jgi:hypothetical protein